MILSRYYNGAVLGSCLALSAALLWPAQEAHAFNHAVYPVQVAGNHDLFTRIISDMLIGATLPAGDQGIVAYDRYGRPIYGNIVSHDVVAYDRYGRPIFSSRVAGTVLVGYDLAGSPIYGYPEGRYRDIDDDDLRDRAHGKHKHHRGKGHGHHKGKGRGHQHHH